jgi:hypothetical protein
MKCPKCGYERLPTDIAPEWQCPSCKVAYVKAAQANATAAAPSAVRTRAAAQPPPPDQAKSAQTRAELEEMELDERHSLAAKGQKIVIYSILLNFVLRAAGQAHAIPDLAILALSLCVGAYSLLGVVKICSGLDKSQNQKILFMVLSFFPLINLVVLVYLSFKTTRMLRAAGWSVGLLGARS